MRKKALERRITRILKYAGRIHQDKMVATNQTQQEYLNELEQSLRLLYSQMNINPPQLGKEINS